jgi:hypothetical protein
VAEAGVAALEQQAQVLAGRALRSQPDNSTQAIHPNLLALRALVAVVVVVVAGTVAGAAADIVVASVEQAQKFVSLSNLSLPNFPRNVPSPTSAEVCLNRPRSHVFPCLNSPVLRRVKTPTNCWTNMDCSDRTDYSRVDTRTVAAQVVEARDQTNPRDLRIGFV